MRKIKNVKNYKTKLLLLSLLSFVFCISPIDSASANTMTVLKSYLFDRNKFTGSYSNERGHQYTEIPSWCTPNGSREYIVGHGWNYHTMQRIFYFTGGY